MDLTVISSNILFDAENAEFPWKDRKDFLANTLLSHKPDLIATQEGWEWQIKELLELLPGYKLICEHRSWIKDRMYPCLFIREDFEVNASGDFWLSATPEAPDSSDFESAFPRLCSWARITVDDKNILWANTHLDHILPSTREGQVKVLASEISKIKKSEDTLILCGDFNEGPSKPVHKFILNNLSLNDPWIELGNLEQSSFHHFRPNEIHGERIDWILHSSRLKAKKILLDQARNQQDAFPSDHYPVIAQYHFS